LAFKNLSILGRCLVNTNIPAPKTEALEMGPKTQNGYFLENTFNDYDFVIL
jgi:hypothetical protein